jgi:hypothetical protein
MKYRKKPVVIEAMQYLWREPNYSNAREIVDWIRAEGGEAMMPGPVLRWLTIGALEGEMNASPGDWIIQGVRGEFYPCKPDIFAATYEPVEE